MVFSRQLFLQKEKQNHGRCLMKMVTVWRAGTTVAEMSK